MPLWGLGEGSAWQDEAAEGGLVPGPAQKTGSAGLESPKAEHAMKVGAGYEGLYPWGAPALGETGFSMDRAASW